LELPRAPVSTSEFWDSLYAGGDDGWELGAPAPPLTAWLDAGGAFFARAAGPARLAVLGCGRGHDARLLAARGHRVWGFDFAAATIAEAARAAAAEGVEVTFERRDIFTLAGDYAGFFDGVWEYTCFCAIDPARRQEYARLVHAVLRPGGLLLACFYPVREGSDGPPFPVSREAIEGVLADGFRLRSAARPSQSIERRRGLEWLVEAERT